MSSPTRRQLVDILRQPLDELPDPLELTPVGGPFDVTIRPPGSKSIMNRALLLAALAEGTSEIHDPLLDAQDAQVMIRALGQLGARFEIPNSEGDPLTIHGTAGMLKGDCTLQLENAGTATRFLTAAACLADAPVVIDGNARMRQRPIGELIELLRELGVTIDELGEPGCVPLRVHPRRPQGGKIEIGATKSSQFISALMMVAPHMNDGLTIRFNEEPTSTTYIDLTYHVMWLFGSNACFEEERVLTVEPHVLTATDIHVEPDASGSSYFLAAPLLGVHPSKCVASGITDGSVQGDSYFCVNLWEFGHYPNTEEGQFTFITAWSDSDPLASNYETWLGHMPDTAQTLAAVACFADGTTTIRGLRTLRVKETDRIAAIQNELSKIGVKVEAFQYENEHGTPDEGIRITPPKDGVDCGDDVPHVVFDTYDDHRMAMSLALIGLRRPNVAIRDPGCVRKTYPTFWRDWSLLYESALAGGEPRGPGID